MSSQREAIAYQTAVSLAIAEGQVVGSLFNGLILANSVIFTAESIANTVDFSEESLVDKNWFLLGFALIGLITSVVWFFIAERGFGYYRLYRKLAEAIEATVLGELALLRETVAPGGRFGNSLHSWVKKLSSKHLPIQRRGWTYIIILSFLLAHLLFLLASLRALIMS